MSQEEFNPSVCAYVKFLVLSYSYGGLHIADFCTHDRAWEYFQEVRGDHELKWAEILGVHREDGAIRLGYYVPSPGV